MHKYLFLAVAMLLGTAAAAWAQDAHSHAQSGAAPASDGREFEKFPEPLVEHTLANMRDHLAALQEIQDHLGMGQIVAADTIERRENGAKLVDRT